MLNQTKATVYIFSILRNENSFIQKFVYSNIIINHNTGKTIINFILDFIHFGARVSNWEKKGTTTAYWDLVLGLVLAVLSCFLISYYTWKSFHSLCTTSLEYIERKCNTCKGQYNFQYLSFRVCANIFYTRYPISWSLNNYHEDITQCI